MTPTNSISERHKIERIRREPQRRSATVTRVTEITPRMRRITLSGPDLAGFESASYEDHLKLYFPYDCAEGTVSRNITPRRYDAGALSLDVDIALHDGPIGNWARDVAVGAPAWIGGPRGSYVIPMDFDWYLLIGDDTALPAIGRRLEELPERARVYVIAEVGDATDEQPFTTRATADVAWLHRGFPDAASQLPAAVARFTVPEGEGYVWAACESDAAKALREQLVARGMPKDWLRVSAYWKRNAGDVHETLND